MDGGIAFLEIPLIIESVLDAHEPQPVADLDIVLKADAWARKEAEAYGRTTTRAMLR